MTKQKHGCIFIFILIFTVTIILSVLAYGNPYFPVDLLVTHLIQRFNPPWFDFLMNMVSFTGDALPRIVLVLVTSGYLLLEKRKKEAITIVITAFGVAIIENIAKEIVHRPRPNPLLIHQVKPFLSPDSFPSGHVLFFMTFLGFLFYLVFVLYPKNFVRRILLIVLGISLILIGPSRIYLGAHWFSDVIGAYLIGFLWLMIVIYFYNGDILKGRRKY